MVSHVLVEKPMTTDLAEADDLVAKAEASGLCLMAGHTFEFNPAVWGLASAIRDPDFGNVRYINSARLNLGLYQPDTDVALGPCAPRRVHHQLRVGRPSPTSVSAWGLELIGEKADVASPVDALRPARCQRKHSRQLARPDEGQANDGRW